MFHEFTFIFGRSIRKSVQSDAEEYSLGGKDKAAEAYFLLPPMSHSTDYTHSPRKTFLSAKTAGFGSPLKSMMDVFAVHGKQS